MRIFLNGLASIGLFFSLLPGALAQEPSELPDNFDTLEERASQRDLERNSSREYAEAVQEFHLWNLNHLKQVMVWHYASGVVIFFVVLFIIFLGLYFSYIQFQAGTNKELDEHSRTTLKLGAAGIEISSSVIGLLTLTISLAFLYLYLENIYPLKPINTLESQPVELQSE